MISSDIVQPYTYIVRLHIHNQPSNMKKKTIIVTHIDTASHGYYSVSKKDFKLVGGEPEKISQYSGHTFSRLYLEEDSDATYFFNKAKENGFEVKVKSGYNEHFAITHNYKSELFDYYPKEGDWLILCNGKNAKVHTVYPDGELIMDNWGTHYKVNKSNPFRYIIGNYGQRLERLKNHSQYETENRTQYMPGSIGAF